MTGRPAAHGTGLHATALIYRESGVLILGPSGSGKSALALALMARARDLGCFSALIGDDRVYVRPADHRLVARGAAQTAGIIERRMSGLIAVGHEPATIIRLAVELCERGGTWPRVPEDLDLLTIAEIRLPRLALDSHQSAGEQALAVDERLAILAAGNHEGIRISLEHCAAVHKNDPSENSPPP